MFIRVVTGIKAHFAERVVEWFMAGGMVYYGLGLVGSNDAWSNPAAWAGMLQYLSENQWGWICISIGTARLVALAVNGTFADTAYARYSPRVRGLSALASATFWFMVLLSVSAVATSGNRIYPLPLAFEVWCLTMAWRDVGRARVPRNGMAH